MNMRLLEPQVFIDPTMDSVAKCEPMRTTPS